MKCLCEIEMSLEKLHSVFSAGCGGGGGGGGSLSSDGHRKCVCVYDCFSVQCVWVCTDLCWKHVNTFDMLVFV